MVQRKAGMSSVPDPYNSFQPGLPVSFRLLALQICYMPFPLNNEGDKDLELCHLYSRLIMKRFEILF